MSGFHSINDFKRESDADDSKRPNEEFSQGGHQSGTAVLRPVRGGDDSGDDISAVIRAAKQQAQGGSGPVSNRVTTITMYRNGFRVGDGEFRDRNDPANLPFIQSLLKGEVPQELEEKAREEYGNAQELGIDVVDKTKEDFVPPKPTFQAFQTPGFASGSSAVAADFGEAVAREVVVNASEPSTTVAIVAHDGRRHRVSLNHSHTVLDLYQHVMVITNQSGRFDLLGGFPPKPLLDPTATIKGAGLVGASIRQKIAQ